MDYVINYVTYNLPPGISKSDDNATKNKHIIDIINGNYKEKLTPYDKVIKIRTRNKYNIISDDVASLHFYYDSQALNIYEPYAYKYDYGHGMRTYILLSGNGIIYSKEYISIPYNKQLIEYCDCIRCSSNCIFKYIDFLWKNSTYDCMCKLRQDTYYIISDIDQVFIDRVTSRLESNIDYYLY